MQPRPDWPELAGTAFTQNGARLAVASRHTINLFDWESMTSLVSFQPEHVVKSYALQFIGRPLGVMTDYGCVSLYQGA